MKKDHNRAHQHSPWEYDTPDEMQEYLAGPIPREDYVRDRESLAVDLRRILRLDGGMRGFEIGSGEGIVARDLAPHCRSLDCADVSRSFLATARATCACRANVRFHRIGDSFLDFLPSASFDFGYSTNVFFHLDEYESYFYLCDVRRVLKEGGLFFFSDLALGEDTLDDFHRFAGFYRERKKVTREFLRWHSLDLVQGLVRAAGLQLVEDETRVDLGHLYVLVRKGGNLGGEDA